MRGVVVLVAALAPAALATAAAAAATTPRFSAPVLVRGDDVWHGTIVAADLNRDGNPDLATVGGPVTVLFGDGNGAFRPQTYPVTGVPDLAVGDVTGDGHLDLVGVRSNFQDTVVVVLVNDGTGQFRRERHPIANADGDMVAVGDFNRDGIADVAVGGCCGLGDFAVLLATGEGRLAGPIVVGDEGPFHGGRDLTVGDFNGDGKLDVALAALGSPAVRVLLGAGDGTFGPARGFGVTRSDASTVTPADLNDDGKLDLVVGREVSSGENVAVLLGNGDGTFGVQTNYRMDERSGDGSDGAALVGDFDGDGIADIADSGSAGWNTMDIRLGAGDGSFGSRRALSPFSAFTSRVFEVRNDFTEAVADFNRDGRLDIAVIAAEVISEEEVAARWIAVLLNWTGRRAPPCVVVPVTREQLRNAKRHLDNAGCRIEKVSYRFSRTARRQRVISQRPAYGAVLSPHARVKLIVSRGRRR